VKAIQGFCLCRILILNESRDPSFAARKKYTISFFGFLANMKTFIADQLPCSSSIGRNIYTSGTACDQPVIIDEFNTRPVSMWG
jgi:hypothetical protein